MILLDPDVDLDQRPPAQKGSSSPETPKVGRDERPPSLRTLSRFLREAQAAVRLRGLVSVLLTTDKKIKTLNRDFRRKNKATDVLSFPAAAISRGEVAGDLAISVETARRQSREHGHTLGIELKVLMLHGLLHLAGYDHETDTGAMARKERALRAKMKLPLGLIERTVAAGGVKRLPGSARNANAARKRAPAAPLQEDRPTGKRSPSRRVPA